MTDAHHEAFEDLYERVFPGASVERHSRGWYLNPDADAAWQIYEAIEVARALALADKKTGDGQGRDESSEAQQQPAPVRESEFNFDDWWARGADKTFTSNPKVLARAAYKQGFGDAYSQPPQPAQADVIGDMVSIDISTCDEDADRRVFGTILEWQESGPDGGRVWLCDLVQSHYPAPQPAEGQDDGRAVPEGFSERFRDMIGNVYHHINEDGDDVAADCCLAQSERVLAMLPSSQQPAQGQCGGAVPEKLGQAVSDWLREYGGSDWCERENVDALIREAVLPNIETQQPALWLGIKCSERLPAEADASKTGMVRWLRSGVWSNGLWNDVPTDASRWQTIPTAGSE